MDDLWKRAELLAWVSEQKFIRNQKLSVIGNDPRFGKNGKDPTSVGRLVQEAVENGIVQFSIDHNFGVFGDENVSLATRLLETFGLSRAIVVSITIDEPDPDKRDDMLHAVLGNHAGRDFRNRLEAGDHIGLTGGRAVPNYRIVG